MTITTLRKNLKKQVDNLPKERLIAASYYLSYLKDLGDEEASRELSMIPGFKNEFSKTLKEYAERDFVDYEDLKNNV